MIWLLLLDKEILVVVITPVDIVDNVAKPSELLRSDCGRCVDPDGANGHIPVDLNEPAAGVHTTSRAFHRFAHTM
jgi:hypothetical protein